MTILLPEKKEEEKRRRMPKTVRPKKVVIDGKAYVKCPYPDCGYMVEDWGYDPKSGLRMKMLSRPDDIYGHIRQVHGLVWLRKGKTAGWWSLSKFHPKPNMEEAQGGVNKEEK